ncbi:MAG: hypothetical protein ACQESN_00310 [Thermotogota bacterium]
MAIVISLFLITFTIYKNIKIWQDDSDLLDFYVEYNSISKILPYIESEELNGIIDLNGFKIYKINNIIKIEK